MAIIDRRTTYFSKQRSTQSHKNMGTKRKIEAYIKKWENRCYSAGIPDEAPLELEQNNLVPSYRKICMAIMKNDVMLETLGYSRPKCASYNELKRIELLERGKIKPNPQLRLKL